MALLRREAPDPVMGPLEAIEVSLRNYANFKGRAGRAEFWWFYAFNVLITAVAILVDETVIRTGQRPDGISTLFVVTALGLFLPRLASVARRLHDRHHSGLWMLLVLLPFGYPALMITLSRAGRLNEDGYGKFNRRTLPPGTRVMGEARRLLLGVVGFVCAVGLLWLLLPVAWSIRSHYGPDASETESAFTAVASGWFLLSIPAVVLGPVMAVRLGERRFLRTTEEGERQDLSAPV